MKINGESGDAAGETIVLWKERKFLSVLGSTQQRMYGTWTKQDVFGVLSPRAWFWEEGFGMQRGEKAKQRLSSSMLLVIKSLQLSLEGRNAKVLQGNRYLHITSRVFQSGKCLDDRRGIR